MNNLIQTDGVYVLKPQDHVILQGDINVRVSGPAGSVLEVFPGSNPIIHAYGAVTILAEDGRVHLHNSTQALMSGGTVRGLDQSQIVAFSATVEATDQSHVEAHGTTAVTFTGGATGTINDMSQAKVLSTGYSGVNLHMRGGSVNSESEATTAVMRGRATAYGLFSSLQLFDHAVFREGYCREISLFDSARSDVEITPAGEQSAPAPVADAFVADAPVDSSADTAQNEPAPEAEATIPVDNSQPGPHDVVGDGPVDPRTLSLDGITLDPPALTGRHSKAEESADQPAEPVAPAPITESPDTTGDGWGEISVTPQTVQRTKREVPVVETPSSTEPAPQEESPKPNYSLF